MKIRVIKKGSLPPSPPKEKDKTNVSSPFGDLIPKRLERKLQAKAEWEADKASRLILESEERKRRAIALLFGE
jgi:hypothetical protein